MLRRGPGCEAAEGGSVETTLADGLRDLRGRFVDLASAQSTSTVLCREIWADWQQVCVWQGDQITVRTVVRAGSGSSGTRQDWQGGTLWNGNSWRLAPEGEGLGKS